MPTTSPKTERSLCQPIPAPGAYSVMRTCWKLPGAMPAKASAPCANADKKFRHVLRFGQSAAIEIIAPAERNGPALAGEAVKLELPERKALDVTQQGSFFLVLRNPA